MTGAQTRFAAGTSRTGMSALQFTNGMAFDYIAPCQRSVSIFSDGCRYWPPHFHSAHSELMPGMRSHRTPLQPHTGLSFLWLRTQCPPYQAARQRIQWTPLFWQSSVN